VSPGRLKILSGLETGQGTEGLHRSTRLKESFGWSLAVDEKIHGRHAGLFCEFERFLVEI